LRPSVRATAARRAGCHDLAGQIYRRLPPAFDEVAERRPDADDASRASMIRHRPRRASRAPSTRREWRHRPAAVRDLRQAAPILPPSLRRLALGNAYRRDAGYRFFSDYIYAFEDDLSDLLAVVPSIAEVRLDLGAVALAWQRPLASEHLQKFEYVSPYVRPDELEVLAASRLPALESFVLWTGSQILVNESSDAQALRRSSRGRGLEDGHTPGYGRAARGEDPATL
jgi:hypothetical protein